MLEALAVFNAEGRPNWKPMHLQPIYRMHGFVSLVGNGRACSKVYIKETGMVDVEIIHWCFA